MSNETNPPTDFVPDSFFEVVDKLIMTHKKLPVPSTTTPNSPPRTASLALTSFATSDSLPSPVSSPKAAEALTLPSCAGTLPLPFCESHPTVSPDLDSMVDFPPLVP